MAEAEEPTVPTEAPQAEMAETSPAEEEPANKELVGEIFEYFAGPGVIAVNLTAELKIGDELWIERGEGKSFRQKVNSMQIDRNPVESAGAGQSVGIKVDRKASKGNKVYKITG